MLFLCVSCEQNEMRIRREKYMEKCTRFSFHLLECLQPVRYKQSCKLLIVAYSLHDICVV